MKTMTLTLQNAVRELGNQRLGYGQPFFFFLKEMKQNKIEKPECAVENNQMQRCREFLVDYKYRTGAMLGYQDFLWLMIQKIS